MLDSVDAALRALEVAEPAEPVPVAADVSPLDFLCSIFRDPGLPLATRIRAATSAAQYCHPRISVLVPPGGNIAERLERLILEQRKKPKLIEHAPLIRRRI
jgi:hypothetical protein